MRLICRKCGQEFTEQEVITMKISLPNGGYHIKASCPDCKVYIKFLSHKKIDK